MNLTDYKVRSFSAPPPPRVDGRHTNRKITVAFDEPAPTPAELAAVVGDALQWEAPNGEAVFFDIVGFVGGDGLTVEFEARPYGRGVLRV